MKKVIVIFFSFSLLFFALSNPVLAQSNAGANHTPGTAVCTDATCLQNPLGPDNNSVQTLIGKVITAVMGVIGSIALLMFIYGGLTWMTSSGNQEKVKKGRGIIVWAAIGLVIIFLSYALTRFVLTSIAGS